MEVARIRAGLCPGRRSPHRDVLMNLISPMFAWLTVLLAACATVETGDPELLAFLRDGSTTREDVYLHLAEPVETFEGGRILAYHVTQDKTGYTVATRRTNTWNVRFSLVLSFDERGILRRHSLVPVKDMSNRL